MRRTPCPARPPAPHPTHPRMCARLPCPPPPLSREVDHVITTRDLGAMMRDAGIDFASLPDEPYDEMMMVGSGAGAIFGTTGGVMEAALR